MEAFHKNTTNERTESNNLVIWETAEANFHSPVCLNKEQWEKIGNGWLAGAKLSLGVKVLAFTVQWVDNLHGKCTVMFSSTSKGGERVLSSAGSSPSHSCARLHSGVKNSIKSSTRVAGKQTAGPSTCCLQGCDEQGARSRSKAKTYMQELTHGMTNTQVAP